MFGRCTMRFVSTTSPEKGVEAWQAIAAELGLPDVTVSHDPYPAMDLKGEMPPWAQHLAMNAEQIGTSGVYVFSQPLFFEGEERVLQWPEFYLGLFLANEETVDMGSGKPIPVRNADHMRELLQEQFLRCRYVPTFQNGDPLPEFDCCRKPLACVHASGE
jgi:hypothetical protein